MALEDDLIDQESADALVQWEGYTAEGVDARFRAAAQADGYTPTALRRAQTSVTEFVRDIVAQVFNVGAAIASGAWRILTGRRPIVRRRGLPSRIEAPPMAETTFDENLEGIISDAERRMTDNPDQAQPIYNQANESTQELSRTEVNRRAANAAEITARALGASGVIWIAERDACVHCTALAGETAAFGEPFPSDLTFGDKPLAWQGYNGRPPRHPNCRCRLIPWDGSADTTDALKREAQRSIARGWSLPSESNAARLRALDRLLRQGGLRLPPSVVRRAREALAAGKFPQGRNFPG